MEGILVVTATPPQNTHFDKKLGGHQDQWPRISPTHQHIAPELPVFRRLGVAQAESLRPVSFADRQRCRVLISQTQRQFDNR